MSILIKGIEMPKDDEILCINIKSNGDVYYDLDLSVDTIANAIRIPPYGRLIEDVTLIQQATWIPATNGRGGHECSACQDYAPSYQNGKERLSLFCPSCGAMMLRRINND